MKKVFKRLAIVAVCVFTFVAIGTVCSESNFDVTSNVNAKLVVPAAIRRGDELEGVFLA